MTHTNSSADSPLFDPRRELELLAELCFPTDAEA